MPSHAGGGGDGSSICLRRRHCHLPSSSCSACRTAQRRRPAGSDPPYLLPATGQPKTEVAANNSLAVKRMRPAEERRARRAATVPGKPLQPEGGGGGGGGGNKSAAAVQALCSVSGSTSVYITAWTTKYFPFTSLSALRIEVQSMVGAGYSTAGWDPSHYWHCWAPASRGSPRLLMSQLGGRRQGPALPTSRNGALRRGVPPHQPCGRASPCPLPPPCRMAARSLLPPTRARTMALGGPPPLPCSQPLPSQRPPPAWPPTPSPLAPACQP